MKKAHFEWSFVLNQPAMKLFKSSLIPTFFNCQKHQNSNKGIANLEISVCISALVNKLPWRWYPSELQAWLKTASVCGLSAQYNMASMLFMRKPTYVLSYWKFCEMPGESLKVSKLSLIDLKGNKIRKDTLRFKCLSIIHLVTKLNFVCLLKIYFLIFIQYYFMLVSGV